MHNLHNPFSWTRRCKIDHIQAGIERVVFYEDKYPKQEFTLVAKDLFDKAGVKYTP